MSASLFNLPGGVEDILSDRAIDLENLRRSLIDLYSQKGFSLVYPSIIEFADAIGGEVNSELKKRAFTFSDNSTSKEIAIRPDISQQIARIDQTSNSEETKKYCYAGEVIKKRKDSFAKSILAIKIGVEIFGSQNSENEIIDAMLMVWERMKIIVEPSCSITLAAILKRKDTMKGKKIGLIMSGGNVDLSHLPWREA